METVADWQSANNFAEIAMFWSFCARIFMYSFHVCISRSHITLAQNQTNFATSVAFNFNRPSRIHCVFNSASLLNFRQLLLPALCLCCACILVSIREFPQGRRRLKNASFFNCVLNCEDKLGAKEIDNLTLSLSRQLRSHHRALLVQPEDSLGLQHQPPQWRIFPNFLRLGVPKGISADRHLWKKVRENHCLLWCVLLLDLCTF